MPVLFKVREGGKLHRSEYINISRIVIYHLTLNSGKKRTIIDSLRWDRGLFIPGDVDFNI